MTTEGEQTVKEGCSLIVQTPILLRISRREPASDLLVRLEYGGRIDKRTGGYRHFIYPPCIFCQPEAVVGMRIQTF